MFVFIFDTKVRLDGQDLRFLDQRWFRQQTGIVHKKPEFFNTSIADNIAYGKGDATFKEIVRAAKAAGAHEFITAFPKVSYSRNFWIFLQQSTSSGNSFFYEALRPAG